MTHSKLYFINRDYIDKKADMLALNFVHLSGNNKWRIEIDFDRSTEDLPGYVHNILNGRLDTQLSSLKSFVNTIIEYNEKRQ